MTDTFVDAPDAWLTLTSTSDVERRVGLSWLSGLCFNRAAPVNVLLDLLDADEPGLLWREDLPPDVLDAAVVHTGRRVRATAADCGRLAEEQWERLIATAQSPRERQLLTEFAEEDLAARRLAPGGRGIGRAPHPGAAPPATPDEIAAAAAEVPDIDPDGHTTGLWWVGALHDDAEAMRRLAASPKLLVRRSVARAARLPEDVAALLAGDEDRVVRLFLAESCDDAPPEVLLEVASWWDGSLSFPGRPRRHPNFPRDGLLRYATDPNPRLRALALDDPAATGAVIEQLSLDADPLVRMAAGEDRRLSPDSLRRLTADPDQAVRRRAWKNPSLPPDALVRLLLDADSAEHAAHNPLIPIPVMRHMVALGRRISGSQAC
ncbi:hypothetical protein EDD96_0213 [Streptomyces sp. Ag109_G2-6]|uniref:hypothetical protein n=1 Tax=Streptomyces TaxID=1883 RepID=UPI0009A47EF6|nr:MULTISPECIES: hypothetical protein [Streptomyces]RPF43704.1 hypothetical protein EDD96_0213 [Streptomyces sp. Ag109_G2-6]